MSQSYCRHQNIQHGKLSLYIEKNVLDTKTLNSDTYAVSSENVTVSASVARNGWLHFDITDTVKLCKQSKLSFIISCIKCRHISISRKEQYKPFITISVREKVHSRIRRRELDCKQSSSCCIRNFYLNFTAIGWSDWIYKPKGFWANYCSGACYDPGREVGVALKTKCCVPAEKEGVTLYFIDGKTGMYYRKTVQNVVVKKCRCTT